MTRYAWLNLTALTLLAITPMALAKQTPKHNIEALRGQGPAGLAIAMESGDDAIIDQVAGQRYARYSGLYWHTDLDEAIEVATAQNKPILSLTLLGDLREEYTCANSRFFRAFLYSNPGISDALRQDFVLHWVSERDVPLVTVNFGGGRVLTRTITGNSVHYLLDSDGTPLDALPGLYSPEAFSAEIDGWTRLYDQVNQPGVDRSGLIAQHHQAAAQAEANALVVSLASVRGQGPITVEPVDGGWLDQASLWMTTGQYTLTPEPPAVVPMMMATSKAFIEMPILDAIDPRTLPQSGAIERGGRGDLGTIVWAPPTEAEWTALAALRPVAFHANSLDLMRTENPVAAADPEMFAQLAANVALDTARNTNSMRPQIRSWFASGQVADVTSLNRRVYDEVFMTPASDPWLGMVDPNAYTGLMRGGVVVGPIASAK